MTFRTGLILGLLDVYNLCNLCTLSVKINWAEATLILAFLTAQVKC